MIRMKKLLKEITDDSNYIYHGTSVGAALSIQREGFLKTNSVGEDKKSISFSGDVNWAMYYAKAKGGSSKQVLLRTKNSDKFELSKRILKNKNAEFITFENIPIKELDVKTKNGWIGMEDWDFFEHGTI